MKDITMEQLQNRDIKVLRHYDILQNDDDDILIVIPMRLACEPDGPVFYYDGGPHGILVGGRMPVIVCDHIHPEVRKALEMREQIMLSAAPPEGDGEPGGGSPDDNAPPVEFMAKMYWQPQIRQLAEGLIASAEADG